MRVGSNPQKKEKKIALAAHHRVVVVVYLPNEDGFYKNSFDVFKTCLDSLVSTINSHVALTVVNNGSYERVSDLLNGYLKAKKIDTLISHNTNIGKIDALIGAARGAREQYITLTDADILFVKGWQEKVEEVFSTFENVGSVSPIPVRTGLFYGTSAVLKQILLRKIKFKYTSIPENFAGYNRYLESINWDLETQDDKVWPVVEKGGLKAIMSSGHQVLTIDRDILFENIPTNPSFSLVGNNSEYIYLDEPIDKAGKLRLSTYHNFAFHMGNKLENWMSDIQSNNEKEKTSTTDNSPIMNKSVDIFFSKIEQKTYTLQKMILKKIFSFSYGKK